MYEELIQRAKALDEKATPGPWMWDMRTAHHTCQLVTAHSGQYYVMQFSRWGMQDACPEFQRFKRYSGPVTERGGLGMVRADKMAKSYPGKEHHKGFDDYIDHPDAVFIAASRALVTELIEAVTALQSENGSKDKEIERLKKTVSALVSDRARAWAERDAAVEDIRFAVVRDDWCVLCAHYCIDGKPAYRPGEGYLEFCMDCGNGCRHFEWRGAQGGVNMGVTIECKKTGRSIDLGCGGFNNLRNKVAELVGNPFAEHYLLLSEPSVMFMMGEARKAYFEKYDQETEKLVTEKKVHIKIADFLYQCDCGGKIRYGACKEILKVIGDYDDNILYGYCGRADCAKFSDFKAILKDCVANKSDMVWS